MGRYWIVGNIIPTLQGYFSMQYNSAVLDGNGKLSKLRIGAIYLLIPSDTADHHENQEDPQR